ncbi:MAG: ABC transporter permease [Bacteroidales bacterium]|nr:ABC transporter permease [Bacteroidales bacterium]
MRYLRNHISIATKSAFRNFRKNWLYGSLNVLGLSVAFATLILVIAYLHQETNYESFHINAERIYRPTYHVNTQSDYEIHFARIPLNYINELPEEIPEIEKLIRFQNKEQKYIRIGEKRFKPEHAYVTDNEVFEVFSFQLLEGDPKTALVNPNSIVLTESVARKYFSRTNILGEEIIVLGDWSAEEKVYRVTGVMVDVPANTHLPADILFSFANEEERSGWAYIYTLLADGASINDVEKKIPDFIKGHSDPEDSSVVSFTFQPIKDIHLESNLAREIIPNGQAIYIKIFFWVGLFVWLIALVNFTNLSTALAMSRGKEVGVRSVLGASKTNLVFLSLTEVIVYSLVSMVIGSILAMFFFQAFSNLTGISILPPLKLLIPSLFLIAFISGLLAGILPSLVLTSIKVIQAIKPGNSWSMKIRTNKINTKRVIITIQFCATIILMCSAMVANRQFKYIENINLGIKPDQIIAIPEIPNKVTSQYTVFKNRLKEIPGISKVSACMQVPSSEIRDVGPILVKGLNQDVDQAPMMDIQIIDPDFIEMMELEFLAGEDFSSKVVLNQVPEFTAELSVEDYLAKASRKYLINETAMKLLGWENPEDAIGQEISWSIGSFVLAYGPVTGVIKDYHQESLKNRVDPLVMVVEPLWLLNILIKIETKDLENTITKIENVWYDYFPYAFEYHFLDELFNRLYKQDRVQLELLSLLAIIAIVISFMGLISLVAYALRRKLKELAIRRVLGADLKSLVILLSKEYILILAIATMIAIPISYKWVSDWLQNFAYHIDISPIDYLLSIILVFAMLFITIYLQTLRATRGNPANILREE